MAKRTTNSCLQDPFQGLYDQVKAGDFIQLEYGQSINRLGKAYGKKTDRWGRSIRVKMLDDSTFEEIVGFTTIGIGAYYLGRGFTPTWENVNQRMREIQGR